MYFIFLGFLQGIFEWLPLSSEGIVSTSYGIISTVTLEQSIALALWLHLGTSFSVLIVFRRHFYFIAKELLSNPLQPSPTLSFLLVSTLLGSIIGFTLINTLGQFPSITGPSIMGTTGILMMISGISQLRRPVHGFRSRDDLALKDSIITGLIQGISVLPGISRSALTMSILFHRRFDKRATFLLNFFLSVPLSLAGALYIGITDKLLWSPEALLGAAASCLFGIISIHALIGLASKLNVSLITIALATLMIGTTALQMAF